MCLIACWAPPSPLMPEHASLFRSGVPLDCPLKGHSLWDFALITPGSAGSFTLYFNFISHFVQYVSPCPFCAPVIQPIFPKLLFVQGHLSILFYSEEFHNLPNWTASQPCQRTDGQALHITPCGQSSQLCLHMPQLPELQQDPCLPAVTAQQSPSEQHR